MKKYYFKEKYFKITDHYPIFNEDGIEEYFLDQELTFIGYKANLTDLKGEEIFRIDRELFTLFPRYNIYFNDNTTLIIQQRFGGVFHKVDVYLLDKTLILKGDFWELNFDIYEDDILIGKVEKEFFALTDSYELTIFKDIYKEELIALVICLNNMIDLDRAHR